MSSRSVVAFRNVSFSFGSAEEPLFADLSAHSPPGFTGILGCNGAGKTTVLRLMIGELVPSGGLIERKANVVYCAQRTDDPPGTLRVFLEDWDGKACELRSRLDIGSDFLERWESLSHGERKRAQIAHALWQSPSVLAIDEPTNHIDTKAREQRRSTRETAIRERSRVVSENKRLQNEILKRREEASREHKVRSQKGLSKKDSDAREKIDRARISNGNAGSQLRQLGGRFAQAQARLKASNVKNEHDTGIWLDGSQSKRDVILKLQAGQTPLPRDRVLKWPHLIVKPDDRIAITGNNGVGKSTWINYVLPLLNVPHDNVVYLPQEVAAAVAREVMAEARALPTPQLGHIMNIVSRLNSRPDRLLESQQPSPGEGRKLLLAIGMSRRPHIIVMDEPTNHLDLPSTEALETALADCPCALLMVSHDRRFIESVGAQSWRIELDEQGDSILITN